MSTGFFWDERTFWHAGGDYAFTLPLGGLVQPMAAGGLPESPETKRRFRNLMEVTGITADLSMQGADPADRAALERVHPASYLDRFKEVSDAGGGELGYHAPFAQGGFEVAALSAGLATAAMRAVATGEVENAYALSRPPGHHCEPDAPMGFCLMANLAIALETARAEGHITRAVVLDWDVHHGNGTEKIYYDRADTLTISLHQEGNYPHPKGAFADRGAGAGAGYNINLPLPAGTGADGYLHALERIVIPQIRAFKPDLIAVACGFDAACPDPLASMQLTAGAFGEMTRRIKALAREICGGKLMLAHEGGYSEVYVPFCGHAVLEALSESRHTAPDPLGAAFDGRQPNARTAALTRTLIDEMAEKLES
ncbi:class II histone deacetylase [Sulfitobacter albidus]|uniref:Class II histone deacetylase n=1 Tax=Sulfitobacter albidus TaxID=2829501 RepID=A0A975JDR8_9RHOB|nr:class II histone deacetylase [Sulfitobacter albidus]QUJ76583.1 class II histone deacetylase [Sulfitobacter albidus]